MAQPKRKLRSARTQGGAIDERIDRKLAQQEPDHHLYEGSFPAQTGAAGYAAGGATSAETVPETFIESIRVETGGTERTGDYVLTATAPISATEISGVGYYGCDYSHDATAVTPGDYTLASITVNQTGHITAASSGSAMQHFHVAGDSGGPNQVDDNDTVTITGGSGALHTVISDDTTVMIDILSDGISDAQIDWGTGAGQVSAVDVPIADAGDYYTGTEVETALQEIGSDLAALVNYWDRTGTTLSPATANDVVDISSNVSAPLTATTTVADGAGNYAIKGSTGSGGLTPVHNTGVIGESDDGYGMAASTATTTAGAAALVVYASAVTANAVHGLTASTNSSSNTAYSLLASERTKLGNWADLDEQASTPADPAAGDLRLYADQTMSCLMTTDDLSADRYHCGTLAASYNSTDEVVNTRTATNFVDGLTYRGSRTLPANFLAAGRHIRLTAHGVAKQAAESATTFTIIVLLGTTEIGRAYFTTPISSLSAVTYDVFGWNLQYDFIAWGAVGGTAAVQGQGRLIMFYDMGIGESSFQAQEYVIGRWSGGAQALDGTTNVATNASQVVNLTVTLGEQSADTGWKCRDFVIEVLD